MLSCHVGVVPPPDTRLKLFFGLYIYSTNANATMKIPVTYVPQFAIGYSGMMVAAEPVPTAGNNICFSHDWSNWPSDFVSLNARVSSTTPMNLVQFGGVKVLHFMIGA